ncbi:hypothetical protein B0H34DRAFT_798630 [Crassisporium funariophilum]|nr:hypothetical protein B0H34DRAFT_798630 [Crassisporium funariophilum]
MPSKQTLTSQAVRTKPAAQKAALVQRQGKVPPPTPAWVQRLELLALKPAATNTSQRRISEQHSPSPTSPASCSRPPTSINGHGKRARSPQADTVAKISANFVKAQKVTEGGGRPKASDYNEVAKEVILTAAAIYCCLISTSNAFPSPSEEAEMIKQAWDRANEDTAQRIPIALSPLIAKMISACGSQIRSKVKACVVMYVETLYGFGSGRGKSIIKQNCKLAEELKHNSSGYLYKNFDNKSGLYQHPIIQKITNKVWFNNPRDEGIVYVDLFDPISVEAIALVLTAVECGIDSWATGVKPSTVPNTNPSIPPTSRRSRTHAGVSSAVSQKGPVLSVSAFAAALKEYEEDTDTEEDGEDLD